MSPALHQTVLSKMSPHRVSDFAEPDGDSGTPALVDGLSDIDQMDLNSLSTEDNFRTTGQVNEPIAIVGIGQYFRLPFIHDLLTPRRMSASRRGQFRRGPLEALDRRALRSR